MNSRLSLPNCLTNKVFVVACVFLLVLSMSSWRVNAESLGSFVESTESIEASRSIAAQRDLRRKYDESPITIKIDLDRRTKISPPPIGERTNWPPQIGDARLLPREYRDDLSILFSDDWVEAKDGSIVSAFSVTSPEAKAIRALLRVQLPPSGEIRFFSPEAARLPLSERSTLLFSVYKQTEELAVENSEPRMIWSPMIGGDTIGIEITLPNKKTLSKFSLIVDKISHIYRPLSRIQYTPSSIECSGHVEVECGSDHFPRGMQNSIALITFHKDGADYLCSGTVLNSGNGKKTLQKKVPYFITANHCISDQVTADSIAALWYFQKSGCDPSSGRAGYQQTSGGAELLTTSVDQDSTLLRLRELPYPFPITFAGWTTEIPKIYDVYGIHHPGGGLKKFSLGETTGRKNVKMCRDSGDCFVVRGAISVKWEEGLTEGGSSGSGLFLWGHLFGVLSGGPVGCTSVSRYGAFHDFYWQAKKWLGPGERCGWGRSSCE